MKSITQEQRQCIAGTDPEIIIAGGNPSADSFNSTDVARKYTPSTDSYTSLTNLPQSSTYLSSFKRDDTRVHFCQGSDTQGLGDPQDNHFQYDTTTDSWTSLSGAGQIRNCGHAYNSTPPKGLIYNGYGDSSDQSICKAWDFPSQTWESRTDVPTAMRNVGCGYQGNSAHTSAGYNKTDHYRYVYTSNTWASKADDPVGNEYRIGGSTTGDYFFNFGEWQSGTQNNRWNEDSWTNRATMPTARAATQSGTEGGYIYVFGGHSDVGGRHNLTASEKYSDSTDSWTSLTSLPTALRELGVTELGSSSASNPSDTVSLSDASNVEISYSLEDTTNFNDTLSCETQNTPRLNQVTLKASSAVTPSQSVTLTDEPHVDVTRSAADSLTPSESVIAGVQQEAEISDSVPLVDSVETIFVATPRLLQVTLQASSSATPSQSVTLTDEPHVEIPRLTSDECTLTDTVKVTGINVPVLSTVTLTEGFDYSLHLVKRHSIYSDEHVWTFLWDEDVYFGGSQTEPVEDEIRLLETFAPNVSLTTSVQDSVAITHYAYWGIGQIAVADVCGMTDAVGSLLNCPGHSIATADQIVFDATKPTVETLKVEGYWHIAYPGGQEVGLEEVVVASDFVTTTSGPWGFLESVDLHQSVQWWHITGQAGDFLDVTDAIDYYTLSRYISDTVIASEQVETFRRFPEDVSSIAEQVQVYHQIPGITSVLSATDLAEAKWRITPLFESATTSQLCKKVVEIHVPYPWYRQWFIYYQGKYYGGKPRSWSWWRRQYTQWCWDCIKYRMERYEEDYNTARSKCHACQKLDYFDNYWPQEKIQLKDSVELLWRQIHLNFYVRDFPVAETKTTPHSVEVVYLRDEVDYEKAERDADDSLVMSDAIDVTKPPTRYSFVLHDCVLWDTLEVSVVHPAVARVGHGALRPIVPRVVRRKVYVHVKDFTGLYEVK